MPVIDTYQKPLKTSKFEKKAYRPWDDLDLVSPISEQQTVSNVTLTAQEDFSNILNNNEKIQIKTLISPQQKNPVKPEITETSSVESVSFSLRGLRSIQRQLVFFIGDLCIARRQLSSGPVTHEMLLDLCNTNINIIKNAIQRLIKKGFLVREVGKKGQGGFSSFLISETLRNVIAQELQQPKFEKKAVERFNNFPKEENSYSKVIENALPEEWMSIDFFPLEPLHFSINHIVQLYKQNKLTAQQVQESIYAFDFDLKENDKGKSLRVGPLNYFMGILKNGLPYAPPQNYENPLEKALKSYIFLSENREKQQQELEKKAIEIAFSEWEKTLSDEDILSICEGNSFANDDGSLLRKGALIAHFRIHVWTKMKKNLVEQEQNDTKVK